VEKAKRPLLTSVEMDRAARVSGHRKAIKSEKKQGKRKRPEGHERTETVLKKQTRKGAIQ